MPSGANTEMRLFCHLGEQRVGVRLTFLGGEHGARLFERLRENRERIEEDLGIPVEWTSENGKHRVIASRDFADVFDPKLRDTILDYLADRGNRFVNAFHTRIERIVE